MVGDRHPTDDSSFAHRAVLALLFFLGVIFLILALYGPENTFGGEGSWQRNLFEHVSTFIFGVLIVSLLYERFLLEKHFRQFRSVMRNEFAAIGDLQSQCIKAGIKFVFPTTSEYQDWYPLPELIRAARSGGYFTSVGLTLFNLLSKEDDIKLGLREGVHFRFA